MKKAAVLLAVTLLLCLQVFSCNNSVYAVPAAGYGRALKDGIVLYRDTTLSESAALFTLTKTYYVYIHDINTAENYYAVEYQQAANGYVNILGYVRKSDIKVWDSPNAPYYPDISATVINSTSLYTEPALSDTVMFIPKSSQVLKLYGSIFNEEENTLYYYVIMLGNRDGYIPAPMLDITLPAAHPDPMPTPTPTPTPTPSTSNPNGSGNPEGGDNTGGKDSLLQILLIAAICIPALIIVYLMFRPSKKPSRGFRQYYPDDEEDDNN